MIELFVLFLFMIFTIMGIIKTIDFLNELEQYHYDNMAIIRGNRRFRMG